MDNRRLLGFWACLALVVGNTIGSGIYLLPASLAPYGLNSVIAWGLTATGALFLAYVFAGLGRAFPSAGGPYAYTRMAFGDLAGFLVAWGYWISIWVANAAIATAAVSYLANLFPVVGTQPMSAFVTVGVVWFFTAVNVWSARAAGSVQVVTMVLKILPLLAVTGLAIWLFATGSPRLSAAAASSTPLSVDAVTAAATLTLWALVGFESAAVAADKIKNPGVTIARATLVGTALTAVIYVLACTAAAMLIPAAQLAVSQAPFADIAQIFWGSAAAHWLALFAVVSCLGALNGWVLLQGEVAFQMAQQGLFPRLFARESKRNTPTAALVVTSVLVSVLVLINANKSTVQLFSFVALLSTTATLMMYLMCALAALKLLRRGDIAAGRYTAGLAIASMVGVGYSLWAIVGAGISTDRIMCGRHLICWAAWYANPVYFGLILLALGVPLFYAMRRRAGGAASV
jgi:basic amino acid/polyamine antiporter, APA family